MTSAFQARSFLKVIGSGRYSCRSRVIKHGAPIKQNPGAASVLSRTNVLKHHHRRSKPIRRDLWLHLLEIVVDFLIDPITASLPDLVRLDPPNPG